MDEIELCDGVRSWVRDMRTRGAERAIEATLWALGDMLLEGDAMALARELPASFVRFVHHGAHGASLNQKAFYRSVARYEDLPPLVSVEHAQAVCRVLSTLLPAHVVARLRTALPHLAWLFASQKQELRPTLRVAPPMLRHAVK